MNREDTKKVLKILSTAYPRYFADMGKEDKIDQVNLYQDMFSEYPTEAVVVALKSYIKDNEYPPSIAGLQKQIDLLLPDENNAVELWNILAKAVKRGSIVTQEEFDQLPKPIKAWCGNLAQLRELGMMDITAFNTVTRGQFLKTVPILAEREKAQQQLPQNVRDILSGAVKSLEGGAR